MNKKILIGSIVMVTVLIGVSFTSVVSYGSVKSTSALNSPLFNIRTRRAIGQEQQDINTDYLGQGEETNIPLSSRIKKAEQVQQAEDIINKMDDKSFGKFMDLILKYLNTRNDFKNYDKDDIILTIEKLRNNPIEITPHILEREESNLHTYACTITWEGCPEPTLENDGILFCILWNIILILVFISALYAMILG